MMEWWSRATLHQHREEGREEGRAVFMSWGGGGGGGEGGEGRDVMMSLWGVTRRSREKEGIALMSWGGE